MVHKSLGGFRSPNTSWNLYMKVLDFKCVQEAHMMQINDLKLKKDNGGNEYLEFYDCITKTCKHAKSGTCKFKPKARGLQKYPCH